MIQWLKSVPGIELHTQGQDGKQINFKLFGGHFAGSLDGVIRGIPEAPKTWHVWECKTANRHLNTGRRFSATWAALAWIGRCLP